MSTVEVLVPDGLSAAAVREVLAQLAASRTASARVAAALAQVESPPGPGVAAQLAAVELRWRHLIERYGAYTSGQIAVIRGADPRNRSVATNLAKTHGLIGFTRGGAKLYPAFEFAGAGPHPNWRAVSVPLREAGWADDDILLWLVSPHPALAGREPAELIDGSDLAELLAVVETEASGVW